LYGGVDTHFIFARLCLMQGDGGSQDFFKTFAAHTLPKVSQIGWIAGKLPLEFNLTRKALVVGILYPALNQNLVTEILQMFEYRETHH